ncbi:hypothetical protein BIY24_12760 [Halobacteriovorax marinus]|uniref:hypothetical protein n=1 Tax=Halobacteriovorax marinus TaxID=97084 RepID=UPI0002DD2A73|nr:hypothetical protein [Halobacteriovorax marinus]ATH08787.1 hypothetical protein BIY24_12760 [Halobacteriovorax marinus]
MTQQNLARTAELNSKSTSTEEMVSFSTLSQMTGFPVDFIKKELLLDEEPISMSQLRESMAIYLESTIDHVRG